MVVGKILILNGTTNSMVKHCKHYTSYQHHLICNLEPGKEYIPLPLFALIFHLKLCDSVAGYFYNFCIYLLY